jgi:Fe-S cluster assembly protein SufD
MAVLLTEKLMTLAATIERSQRERESWKYTSLKALQSLTYAAAQPIKQPPQHLPRRLTNTLVFVNGFYQAALSRLPDFPPDILQTLPQGGYQLTLDDRSCMVASPLELLFVQDATDSAVASDTALAIQLGVNGRLTLIERHVVVGPAAHAATLALDISLAQSAKLVHGKVVQGSAQLTHLATSQVTVAQGAYYDNFALLLDGGLTRNEITVALQGPMAQTSLQGAMLLRGAAHADTTTRIIHEQPHGTSRQIYKSVLADKAHGVFQGKVIVKPQAQKTDGYQLSRALLLSDQAEMDAKPELEIYADDVKCSHGSTVGDLDAEALFYLRARGIDTHTARALLVAAFVNELVDSLPAGAVRELMQDDIAGWLT